MLVQILHVSTWPDAWQRAGAPGLERRSLLPLLLPPSPTHMRTPAHICSYAEYTGTGWD